MNRLIKRKNLFALLFAVLLALPMCAILGRVLYTQWNKNAKDSYSQSFDISYKYETNEVTSASDIVIGNIYTFTIESENTSYITYGYFSAIYNINGANFTTDILSTSYIALVQSGTTHNILLQLPDSTTITTIPSSMITYPYTFNVVVYSTNIIYTYLSESDFNILEDFNVNEYSFLDNAFEYSVNQFINDNNFGKLDFFQWFDNMFLDSNNSVNNMYVHFVNWYLNYALLISLAYILFLVLMWFINYVRKLLERGMDFGEGSY